MCDTSEGGGGGCSRGGRRVNYINPKQINVWQPLKGCGKWLEMEATLESPNLRLWWFLLDSETENTHWISNWGWTAPACLRRSGFFFSQCSLSFFLFGLLLPFFCFYFLSFDRSFSFFISRIPVVVIVAELMLRHWHFIILSSVEFSDLPNLPFTYTFISKVTRKSSISWIVGPFSERLNYWIYSSFCHHSVGW